MQVAGLASEGTRGLHPKDGEKKKSEGKGPTSSFPTLPARNAAERSVQLSSLYGKDRNERRKRRKGVVGSNYRVCLRNYKEGFCDYNRYLRFCLS